MVRKAAQEAIQLPLNTWSYVATTVAITGPDGRNLLEKTFDGPYVGRRKWQQITVPLELSENDPRGDYRIEIRAGRRLVGLHVPFEGTYRKLVMRLPLDLYWGGRMYFLPTKVEGRKPWLQFDMQGRTVAQFCRLTGPAGKQQVYAENDGGRLRLRHDPDPQLTGKLWFFFKGRGSNMMVRPSGDVFRFVSFRKEHFFIPAGMEKEAGSDVDRAWLAR